MADSVSLRLQLLPPDDQAIALLMVAEGRDERRRVAPSDVEALFHDLRLPLPGRMSNRLASLQKRSLAVQGPGRGAVWSVSPLGRERVRALFDSHDLSAIALEAIALDGSLFGATVHPLLPAVLSPPAVAHEVASFLADQPFEQNVFCMTRFPQKADSDPLKRAIGAAREACDRHGLTLLLASDRALVDDLWPNVMAYMWASKYGLAFFENQTGSGVNLNMSIEVGAMMMAGRRCALLKDVSVKMLPTDLVGKIYRPIDLSDPSTVATEVDSWIADDLIATVR